MRLTTKGRYAVTAMLDLALHEEQGPITLADISSRQGVSVSYLEQLFAKLRRHRLVDSVRGPGGGYRLAGAADSISVADIVEAVNDSMDATRCLGKGDCQDGTHCLTHHLWSDLSDRLREFLGQISLADLVSRDDIQQVRLRQDRQVAANRQIVLERII
ncbi:MAG: Fe-S cluster assembly transcriptional regulator IscR [Halopseudomonas yangmingensis]|uniref:Transcriptional regulator, BadM/Rrf2 family n=1 Tax=Halopseudomonas yangmingensis TaxID=1720063 RepID=A0A1I4QH47_9GAMM|nr:Fe-S cluster assembly transcriptional regulator IscR [Halopseudomonas yangmingensis]SFM39347.1 transcriptional regulator, BadM/Rrf2 family [Halopseudomonas yangmingensis]